jgi:penicillin-binding protein 1C
MIILPSRRKKKNCCVLLKNGNSAMNEQRMRQPQYQSRTFSLTRKKLIDSLLSTALACAVLTAAVFFLTAPRGRVFHNPYSRVVTDKNGELIRVFLNEEEQWFLPPEEDAEIPQKLIDSVLAFEDRYFFSHAGVNLPAVFRAFCQNIRYGRRISGASTITMQLARLADPKKRSFLNKIREAAAAVKMEFLFTKDEILKMYLDHAPYGGNIWGYRTASLKYFEKEPDELTWAEAACLAVLPNAPSLITPETKGDALFEKRNRLLAKLYRRGAMDNDTYRLALREPLPEKTHDFPAAAPHLADKLIREVEPSRSVIETTIDREIQRNIENQLINHSIYLKTLGIKNTAAIIVETETGKVRAYAGSQDYFDNSINGAIDGIQAYRSTGSILKPFLYALAIDEGLISPESLLADIPSWFGAFSPQNADESYSGLVSAKEALIRSLNIPAVDLLNRFGLVIFFRFLKRAGMDGLFRTADDYGLPLILGGAEASPEEIAAMYRSLARGGNFSSIRYLKDSAEGEEQNLLSSAASFLTLEMLKDVARPGSEAYWNSYRDRYPLAWKTGTSYGRRDAWAVGVNPQWTIVVWAGNFTGESNANIRSSRSAGLLLFDIFNALPKDPGKSWFAPEPGSLQRVEICAETGYRAGNDCGTTKASLLPVSAKPLAECPYHRTIYVTTNGKYRVNSLCWEEGKYKKMSILVLPPAVTQFLRKSGQRADTLPPIKPGCSETGLPNPLSILYPAREARFYLPRDLTGNLQRITFRAAHQQPDTTVYWYFNGAYIGSTTEDHTMAPPLERGRQELYLVDEWGNSVQTSFFIEFRQDG